MREDEPRGQEEEGVRRRIGIRGSIEQRFVGHTGVVHAMSVHPVRGDVFATGSDDKRVRVWEIGRESAIATLPDATGSVMSVGWSGDGRRMVSGSNDGRVRVYSEARGSGIDLITTTMHLDGWVRGVGMDEGGCEPDFVAALRDISRRLAGGAASGDISLSRPTRAPSLCCASL